MCSLCQEEFKTERKLTAHMNDGTAHKKAPPAWSPDDLAQFDLSPNTMVAALSQQHRELLCTYMLHAAPQWPELSDITSKLATEHPTSLRLKEFVETVEAFTHIGAQQTYTHTVISCMYPGQFVYEQTLLKPIDCIMDLACGHGLLGVSADPFLERLALAACSAATLDCMNAFSLCSGTWVMLESARTAPL